MHPNPAERAEKGELGTGTWINAPPASATPLASAQAEQLHAQACLRGKGK